MECFVWYALGRHLVQELAIWLRLIRTVARCWSLFLPLINSTSANHDDICWKSPEAGQVALNCDAAVIQLGNQSTCGRVIRDHNVAFLCSFHAKIGSCSVIYAELWPFSWASNWLGLVGLRFVLIQSRWVLSNYSKEAVVISTCALILLEIFIQSMLIHARNISWNHIFREANQVARGLTKYALHIIFLNFLLVLFFMS